MAVIKPSSVKLKYTSGNGISTTNSSFNTKEGNGYTITPLLSGAHDVILSKHTLLTLTHDKFNYSDYTDKAEPINKTSFITKSVISVKTDTNVAYLYTDGTENSTFSTVSDVNSATVFNLVFLPTTFEVSFMYGDFYVSRNGSYGVNLQYERGDKHNTQVFNYTLYNDQIVIFTSTNDKIFILSGSQLSLTNYTTSNFSTSSTFYLNRYNYNSTNTIGESDLVKYVTTPNNITINTVGKPNNYNYLLLSPFTELTNSPEDELSYNITALKNYYSPEGIQTPTLSTQLRSYYHIYSGLNSETGADKIYLGYRGEEIQKTFYKDKNTYFHFPVSSLSAEDGIILSTPLSSSTLAKSGALGGSSPVRSDRIFVKEANYRKYSNWGNYPGNQTGVFFCSWLSAGKDNTVEPVWMDRYFDPNRVNITSVLSSTSFTNSNNNYPNVIWDVPSTQILVPQCLYVYHRIGDNDNLTIVDALSSTLSYHIQYWSQNIVNEVTKLSAGTTVNYTSSAVEVLPNTRDESLNTALSYGNVTFKDSDLNSPGITFSFQAYNTDWRKIRGGQIVGNYYDGGIGLYKNITLLTPFETIIGDDISTFNTKLVSLKNTQVGYPAGRNFILKGEYDSSYFVVTSDSKLYEYDQDDLLVNQYSLANITGSYIGAHLIKDNSSRKIIVTTRSNNSVKWFKYNTSGSYETSGTSLSGYNNYALNVNNEFVYFNSLSGNGTVDSSNRVFALSGDILTRNSTPVLSALSAEYVACDHQDNIWVLYANTNVCKLDNYGNVIWDVKVTDVPMISSIDGVVNPTSYLTRTINFISELNPIDNSLIHSGLIIDGKTQKAFKIDPANGTVLKTTTLNRVKHYGDGTGYEYQRRYVYSSVDNSLVVKAHAKNIATLNNTGLTVKLNYNTVNLTPGWHHFAITLNPDNILTLYVDGNDVASTLAGSLSAIYRIANNKNNPNLIIGTSSFKVKTLSEYTKESTDIYRFNGKVADVRVYNQALNEADIKALQKRFILTSFSNLKWSVPTGQRYYIEKIDRFFQHKLPGSKSNMFNLKIRNAQITNEALRKNIEKNIVASLSKSIPVHTLLKSIIWE